MRRLIAVLSVLAALTAACGNDGGASETTATDADATTGSDRPEPDSAEIPSATTEGTSEPEPVELTASFRGVTEEVIRVGVMTFDWDALAEIGVNFGRTNSGDLYVAALERINDRGGIHGRMLEIHEVTYLPAGSVPADEACFELTEDKEVFVVVGLPLNDQILCFTEINETAALVANGMTENRQERARAPYVAITPAAEFRTDAFIDAMEATGVLDGATLGVTGSVDVNLADYNIMIEALQGAGYSPVEGLIGGNEDDLAQSARDQENIYQRMVDAGVDVTISTTGVPLTLVNAVAAGYETDQWLMSTLMQGRGLTDAGVDHAYIDGAIGVTSTLMGTSEQPALADEPLVAACIDELETRTGRDLPFELDAPVSDAAGGMFACALADVLEAGLTNAGPELTNDSFQAGLEAIGDIELPGYFDASLGVGDMGVAKGLHVVEFDGATGIWNIIE